MFNSRVFFKLLDLLKVFAVFWTPLLFFIVSRDQFELPKLTFLALLLVPFLLSRLFEKDAPRMSPLAFCLFLLLGSQALASLPSTSLSWTTSLMGEYENFSGLVTTITLLAWFWFLSRTLNESRIEKLLHFNSLAAFLSALYGIGQHFQFDFIAWNPESVNATREFAALGNPNFLSAYLAMSIPLFLTLAAKSLTEPAKTTEWPGPFVWFSALLGLFLLVLSTGKGQSLLPFPLSPDFGLFLRTLGLVFFALSCLRFGQFKSWPLSLFWLAVLLLGLFSTASRGGFLGALLGVGFWGFLVFRQKEWRESLCRALIGLWISYRPLLSISGACLLAALGFFGRSFLQRLFISTVHFEDSLAVSRLHIWRPAVGIIKAHPLLGVGLDNFKIAFPYYSGIEYNLIDGMFNSSRMAHNELLQVASTTGFVGLAAYLLMLGVFGWMGWKTYRVAPPNGRWLLTALFSSAVAYHVQNLFSFGVATINLLWFFILACMQYFYLTLANRRLTGSPPLKEGEQGGVSLSGRLQQQLIPPHPPFSKGGDSNRNEILSNVLSLLQKGIALLLALFLLFFPLRRLGADIAYSHGSAASDFLKNPDPQADPSELVYYSTFGIDHLTKAAELCPLEVKYRLYLGLAYEQRAKLDPEHLPYWYLKALDCYQKAVKMSPANAYYYNDEGRIDDLLGSSDRNFLPKAEEAYAQAVHWAPASPFFIINWAMAIQKEGKEKEYREQLQKAFQLSPLFASRILSQMADNAYRAGDKKGAFQLVEEAIQGDTSCAEAYYCRATLHLRENENKVALVDLEKVKSLNPTPDKNPSIKYLDEFIEEARKLPSAGSR